MTSKRLSAWLGALSAILLVACGARTGQAAPADGVRPWDAPAWSAPPLAFAPGAPAEFADLTRARADRLLAPAIFVAGSRRFPVSRDPLSPGFVGIGDTAPFLDRYFLSASFVPWTGMGGAPRQDDAGLTREFAGRLGGGAVIANDIVNYATASEFQVTLQDGLLSLDGVQTWWLWPALEMHPLAALRIGYALTLPPAGVPQRGLVRLGLELGLDATVSGSWLVGLRAGYQYLFDSEESRFDGHQLSVAIELRWFFLASSRTGARAP